MRKVQELIRGGGGGGGGGHSVESPPKCQYISVIKLIYSNFSFESVVSEAVSEVDPFVHGFSAQAHKWVGSLHIHTASTSRLTLLYNYMTLIS